jgi:hypothetical protein
MLIYALVEGITDEAMARRLASTTGHEIGACYGKQGSSWIKEHVAAINRFILEIWSPERARRASPSLDRCLLRLGELG